MTRAFPARRLYEGVALWLDRRRGWDRLPTPLGIVVLIGLRNLLRRRNLFPRTDQPAADRPQRQSGHTTRPTTRTADGSGNDLADPAMGMAGSQFGRNIPLDRAFPDPPEAILQPSPREVSRVLLTRPDGKMQAADRANALVAAWVQFMIRDWLSHERGDISHAWEIDLSADDLWPQNPMRIAKTPPSPTRPDSPTGPGPTFVNTQTHWWDASQLYGNNEAEQRLVRTAPGGDGKLRLPADGVLPLPKDPNPKRNRNPSQIPGFWLGLVMLQDLFAQEHNEICDRLHRQFPSWSDDELFERTRLIVAALLAKIHTVEWTPVVIGHPITRFAIRANWWGLAGKRFHRLFGRIGSGDILSGIPGSRTRLFGAPYAMTEEFVAVYRMHPLLPDEYDFRSAADDQPIETLTLEEIAGPNALGVLRSIPMPDLLYSFGTINPGLVTLHNYPRFLQTFKRPDGQGIMDLGATDILRTRELGVPRYNEFRRLLNLPPAKDFESLTDNPDWVRELRQVYRNDIEQVDLMVGMFAERRPKGFAFSDTAFRIFILMASRRLNSDRFFTADYTPDVYTRFGLDWVERTTMRDVLRRHYPDLEPALTGVKNAFRPWVRPSS